MPDLFNRNPRGPDECWTEALGVIGEAIDIYKPSKIFGMFSGGHDSLCAVHVASQFKLFAGACHINTGIGVEETREYVRRTAKDRGWPLLEYKSPITYESLVLKWGFPGPAGHGVMYSRLKERCIRMLTREHKVGPRDRVMLVGGMRYAESTRRMANSEPHHREGCRVWCSPIVHWTTDERNVFIDSRKLPKNPVVGRLCMSGECLCGAFAKPNEIVEIERFYPELAKQIHDLEAKAEACGVHATWGTRPPKKLEEGSGEMPLFSLCWSCGKEAS
jgi:3'-phosphoadenosine 5'-phosphosulfate sulfotransferase (PAPS reductase)/FAD synthetase